MNDPITHHIWRDNTVLSMSADAFRSFIDKPGDWCLFRGDFYKASAVTDRGGHTSYASARPSDVPIEFKAALLIEGITHG
jgi:hypothetical protein